MKQINLLFDKIWSTYSKRTCCLIFFCELVALTNLLLIGFVYVHVYVPNYNAKRFPRVPVVCSTTSDKGLIENCELPEADSLSISKKSLKEINHPEPIDFGHPFVNKTAKDFQWSSCGEFCSPEITLAKVCRQVRVDVRSPGSEIRLIECEQIDVVECGFRISRLYDFDGGEEDFGQGCSNQTEHAGQPCPPLEGLYTCHMTTPTKETNSSSLECTKIITSWTCNLPTSSSNSNINQTICRSGSKSSVANCLRKPGLHFCNPVGFCVLITNLQEMCVNANKCEDIPLQGKNVIINHNNEGTMVTARCSKGFDTIRGNEVWPRGFRNRLNPKLPPALLINCNHIRLPPPTISTDPNYHEQQKGKELNILLGDCVNGTLVENTTLPASTSLENLMETWHEALTHEDFMLDPINQNYAPPETNLSLFSNVRLYYSDYYKVNGCSLILSDEVDKCGDFYETYARLPGHFRGQSLFPCYCRSTTKGPPFCIIGDRDLFTRNWEDVLVQEWIVPYKIFVLTLLSILLGLSLLTLCFLLYPLITDSISVDPKNQVEKEEDDDDKGSFQDNASTRQNSQGSLEIQTVVQLTPKLYELRSQSRRTSLFLTPVSLFSVDGPRD